MHRGYYKTTVRSDLIYILQIACAQKQFSIKNDRVELHFLYNGMKLKNILF